ncbi:hypothetical protein GBAR_LOCUS28052 [Geodia barretti]|uniref:Uncharacterized protein n=1 Tax=Geodia barretti TaxID=519541 RepID=A0AA35XH21_GEOBA|nr:hypothetical protein GBAR_LOCUS28052 [Geodia barretti]
MCFSLLFFAAGCSLLAALCLRVWMTVQPRCRLLVQRRLPTRYISN